MQDFCRTTIITLSPHTFGLDSRKAHKEVVPGTTADTFMLMKAGEAAADAAEGQETGS